MSLRPWLLILLASVLVVTVRAVPPSEYLVTNFGRFTGHVPEDTAVIQAAIDACAQGGGGRVTVPGGLHVTVGSLQLRSHVELYLQRGSELKATPVHDEFGVKIPYPVTTRPGEVPPQIGVMIYANEADDVAITGSGTVDGNSPAYVAKHGEEIDVARDPRPYTIVFRQCRHVTLRDVTVRDGAFWTIRTLGCDDVLIADLRIDNSLLQPNNDGIDVDWSSNVRIRDCNIVSGDDCIALKTAPQSMGVSQDCRNVVITGCTLKSKSSAVVIGSDVVGTISDVVVSNCAIWDSHRGVSVRLNMSGRMERILFSNLTIQTRIYDPRWWGRGTPIDVVVTPWNAVTKPGHVRDIRFSNIVARGENGVVVYGYGSGLIDDISFDRVAVHIDKTTAYAGGHQDFRPAPKDEFPEMPTSGFLLRNASNVMLRDCTVTWGEHRPDYYRYAIDAQGVTGLEIRDFRGESADPAKYPARLIR